MATGGNPTQQPNDLEVRAHDFLLGDELAKKNEELAKRFGLKEKSQDDLADAENAVVFKEISVPEFIDIVKRIAVLNKKSSADFLDAIAENFLFPLDEYFKGESKRLLEKNKPTSSSIIPAKAGIQSTGTGSPIKLGMTNKASASQVVIREAVPRPRENTDLAKKAASSEKAILRAPVPRLKEEPSVLKLKAESVDPRAAKIADAVIVEIGLGDKNLENKLREIIVARVAGSKDDLETKAMLKRSVNTGGVGLEESLAETLLGMIKTKAGIIPKVPEAPKAEIKKEIPAPPKETLPTKSLDKPEVNESGLPGFIAPSLPSIAPKPTPSKLTTDWLHTEQSKKIELPPVPKVTSLSPKPLADVEARELKTIKEKIVDLPRPSTNNETLVEQVLVAVQFPFKNDIQKTRFINAIKNRIRDIRDQFETKELLLRSENLGGVGLGEGVADQASVAIEKIVGEQNRRQTVAKKEELQTFDVQSKSALVLKTQSRVDQNLAAQDARYKNLVAEKIKSVLDRPLGFLKRKEVPTIEVPEIMMPKAESAKMTVPLPRLDESKSSRPKMEDIKFSPTLVGPIEELKNFTLKDWQALGAKASVISQKLSVLRNESYTKYITALASFRESPLFVLAQEILFESLEKNMPLAGLIEMRKKENKPYLSQTEINDILSVE